MKSFDEILTSILKEIEENPTANIDELLAVKISELGISEEGMKTFQETSKSLESFDEMFAELQVAKSKGDTRSEWVQEQILNIGDKHQLTDEQKEQLITDIASVSEKNLESTLVGRE